MSILVKIMAHVLDDEEEDGEGEEGAEATSEAAPAE